MVNHKVVEGKKELHKTHCRRRRDHGGTVARARAPRILCENTLKKAVLWQTAPETKSFFGRAKCDRA